MIYFLDKLLSYIYPSFCYYCYIFTENKDILCLDCKSRLESIDDLTVHVNRNYTLNVIAAYRYTSVVKKIILRKFYSDIAAMEGLSKLVLERMDFSQIKADYVVPIPLHVMRYSSRGFNQAEIIAKKISKQLNVPMVKLIQRNKKTVLQSMLTWRDREKNIKDAFVLNGKVLREYYFNFDYKRILLVDDLCTTGTTLRNAGKALSPLNPKEIFAMVVARKI